MYYFKSDPRDVGAVVLLTVDEQSYSRESKRSSLSSLSENPYSSVLWTKGHTSTKGYTSPAHPLISSRQPLISEQGASGTADPAAEGSPHPIGTSQLPFCMSTAKT